MEHLELIKRTAARLSRRLPRELRAELYADLISYGAIGLMRAQRKFDPEKGKFENYAAKSIAGAILDGMRSLDPAPRHFRKKFPEHVTVPTEPSIMAQLSHRIIQPDPGTRAMAYDLLQKLSEPLRQTVEMYYFGHMTMREIGCRFGISESAVCLRIKAALRRMKG